MVVVEEESGRVGRAVELFDEAGEGEAREEVDWVGPRWVREGLEVL